METTLLLHSSWNEFGRPSALPLPVRLCYLKSQSVLDHESTLCIEAMVSAFSVSTNEHHELLKVN